MRNCGVMYSRSCTKLKKSKSDTLKLPGQNKIIEVEYHLLHKDTEHTNAEEKSCIWFCAIIEFRTSKKLFACGRIESRSVDSTTAIYLTWYVHIQRQMFCFNLLTRPVLKTCS